MHITTVVPVLLVLTMAMPAIQAVDSEGHLTDVRLEVILLPENYDYDSTARSGLGPLSRSGSADFDRPFRIGFASVAHMRGVDYGPIGLVGGGAIYYTRLPVDNPNVSERYEALSVQARLGLGLYVGDIIHVELTPFAGIGGARGTIDSAKSDIGLYLEYGISAGAFVSLGSAFQLGLIGGWIHGEYDLDFNADNNFPSSVDSVNSEVTQEGLFVGISIGSRM